MWFFNELFPIPIQLKVHTSEWILNKQTKPGRPRIFNPEHKYTEMHLDTKVHEIALTKQKETSDVPVSHYAPLANSFCWNSNN